MGLAGIVKLKFPGPQVRVSGIKGGSLAARRVVNFLVSRHQAEIMHSNTGHAAAAPHPSFGSGADVTEWPLGGLRFIFILIH